MTPLASRFSRCTCPAFSPAMTKGEWVVAKICNPGKCFSNAGNDAPLPSGVQVIFNFVNQQDRRLVLPSRRRIRNGESILIAPDQRIHNRVPSVPALRWPRYIGMASASSVCGIRTVPHQYQDVLLAACSNVGGIDQHHPEKALDVVNPGKGVIQKVPYILPGYVIVTHRASLIISEQTALLQASASSNTVHYHHPRPWTVSSTYVAPEFNGQQIVSIHCARHPLNGPARTSLLWSDRHSNWVWATPEVPEANPREPGRYSDAQGDAPDA